VARAALTHAAGNGRRAGLAAPSKPRASRTTAVSRTALRRPSRHAAARVGSGTAGHGMRKNQASGRARTVGRAAAGSGRDGITSALAPWRLAGPATADAEMFDSLLLANLRRFDPARPIWLEAESKRIGLRQLPDAMFAAMHQSPVLSLSAPMDERVRLCRSMMRWNSCSTLPSAARRLQWPESRRSRCARCG
jgi:hypothetical protein